MIRLRAENLGYHTQESQIVFRTLREITIQTVKL